ncbi:MAG: ATP-dependent DNA helicase RecG [Candidatus Gracilibacteria bacterium]|nr:ATP-dependent DNA helicase RecG [Candidatus Gracilibacteria bacterium]
MLKNSLSIVLRTTPAKIKLLDLMGIKTVEDLLLHYPFRYEDKSEVRTVNMFNIKELNNSRGRLSPIKNHLTKFGKKIQRATFTDEEGGTIDCVWFNQAFLATQWPVETKVMISGKVKFAMGKISFQSPTIERWKENQVHTGSIVPTYHETDGISSKWIREKMRGIVSYSSEFEDILPEEVRQQYGFPKKSKAIKSVHFPDSSEQLEKAKQMLAFEELFILQLSALQQKKLWSEQDGATGIPMNPELIKAFQEELPFELTGAQKISLYQILKDCEKTQPMLRMLQGDVGSGKTIVAAMAMLAFLKNGYQCVVMSPTEILTKQHYENLSILLSDYSSVLLIGSLTAKEKREAQENISKGAVQLIIGTHAVIQDAVEFPNLAFAVIDEQHRFGVVQRAAMVKKSTGPVPHLLMMSATPIPRTLALTIYGDQELSVIDEMPPGRKPIITKVVHPDARRQATLFIDDQINKGRQVFVICPLIEESEKLEAKSVLQEFERLKEFDFPHRKIQYIHGKMKAPEKDEIMRKFKEKEYDILVSTSVIEVGIDIPNASIMVIEGAERFGLSQLHQFRGRVGRNDMQSYCFLYTTNREQRSIRRLTAMAEHTDGFKLAEIDLDIRGPGEVYGLRQSGLPDLKMANIMDGRTIAMAREKAQEIIDEDVSLSRFPVLKNLVEKAGGFWKA